MKAASESVTGRDVELKKLRAFPLLVEALEKLEAALAVAGCDACDDPFDDPCPCRLGTARAALLAAREASE